ncbi:hypothetical protein M9Y10_032938 [Tritrichomonas musculus]|uniref:Serpin domain-containing protein n=1 Tax=Tritrichomonas musculus TaxID=1915356 RepID=A0ABR2GZ47_9EUKA
MSKLVESLNKFGFETLHATNPNNKTENAVFSPFSAFICVAMSTPIFQNETRAEILKSLQISSDGAQIEPILQKLHEFIKKEDTDNVSSSNRIWANQSINFNPKTFELNQKVLEIPIDKVSFPQPACDIINEDVNKKTKGMIPKLVEPSDLSPDTAIVLLNAIYFKSDWEKKFEIDPTSYSPKVNNFTLADGTQIHANMIRSLDRKLPYAENGRFQAVSIPYLNNQYDFVIVLPKKGAEEGYNDLTKLTYNILNNELLSRMRNQKVNIRLPKFTIESKIKLNDVFKSLGMEKAFSQSADCTDPSVKYYVNSIIQKAKIIVDENGTVAAAATGMSINALSIETTYDIFADHPFAYLLRNRQTGSILFEGFVKNPSA